MKVAIIIPAYRCRAQLIDVLQGLKPFADRTSWQLQVIVVDDACPEGSGDVAQGYAEKDQTLNIRVIRRDANGGVGAAVKTGFSEALRLGVHVVVKMDGDGQMDPQLLPHFVNPIARGDADYAKGNRFFTISGVQAMPKVRVFGNAVLSFICKGITGYWRVMDPTNGYFAIHARALPMLEYGKLSDRFFFETDLLFRLNIVRARVIDIPMDARYGTEVSNLRISRILATFPPLFLNRFFKRIFYSYFLRDFSIASLELVGGIGLLGFGVIFGVNHWMHVTETGVAAPTGTVMLAALTVLLGFQLLLSFLSFDMSSEPTEALYSKSHESD